MCLCLLLRYLKNPTTESFVETGFGCPRIYTTALAMSWARTWVTNMCCVWVRGKSQRFQVPRRAWRDSIYVDETSMRVVVYIWIYIIYIYNHSLPEICNALVLLALSSKVMTTETWEVIGGAISGGLLVRHGKALGPDRWRVKRWNCEVNMPWNFPESKWWSSLWAFGDFQGSGLRWYRFGDAMWLRCVFEIIWGFTVQNKPVLLLH